MKASRTALAFSLLATGALAIAACVPAPDSTPAPSPSPTPVTQAPRPAPTPTPSPAPPAAAQFENWIDAPRTAGNWRYRSANGLKVAEYVGHDNEVKFQMDCSPEIGMLLSVAGDAAKATAIQFRTESTERLVPADAREGWVQAVVRPTDPLLDAMARTRGRFAVETPGLSTLYLPPWAEVTRVIEECR
ncbi:hypothetical protein K3162_03085 [Qipengyuania xiapuensis]|uniref:Lipoprotein n=1 Tax=Qipengyuania xiapuensis TaxID=2867236 RepID=A0ABX8ZZK4_9SPHN|nr:hypothetical protein [Qipengyuania xiapuensis]QZD93037.1 hypothetical protein K3162_03085 [Qipengyuania xiapuensis]